ncbi:integrase [Novosphingobium barchaimii]|nr:integrase [Novosphingobium barchaimii]
MRGRDKLSARRVATVKEPGIYSDGGGLYLRVRPSGSKSWVFIYSREKVRREMGLGSGLDVSLAKARERARTAREMLVDQLDPLEHRKHVLKLEAAPEPEAARVVTFGDFADELIESIEEGFRNPKHRAQWRSSLAKHAASLYPLAVDQVTTEHITAALQKIWLTKAETASRVRGRIERVLDAAKAKGLRSGENPATWKGHLELLLPKQGRKVKHHAALPFSEMGAFMADLSSRSAVSARALEFIILTAARSGEVRGMKWQEIDLDAKVWTVPAERMKAGVEHQVPLSDPALAVLAAVRPTEPRADALVFRAERGGQMSDMIFSALLKRMNRGDVTTHGFRSTFRDWVGEATEFAREDAEMALAHTISSAVERAYRRGRALEKRRRLMDAWAVYCLAPSDQD